MAGDDISSAVNNSLNHIISEYMEYSTEEEDEIGHVDLYFMNAEDVLLNHPTLILKLGLVEVLKVMVGKGFIQSMWMSLTQMITITGIILSFGGHTFIHPMLRALIICSHGQRVTAVEGCIIKPYSVVHQSTTYCQ